MVKIFIMALLLDAAWIYFSKQDWTFGKSYNYDIEYAKQRYRRDSGITPITTIKQKLFERKRVNQQSALSALLTATSGKFK